MEKLCKMETKQTPGSLPDNAYDSFKISSGFLV